MPRGLSTEQKTALSTQRRFGVVYLVELTLDSGAVRVWNGVGNLSALSQTWLGVGDHGVISGIEGDRSLRARSISVALVGIPGEYVSAGVLAETRAERYQGRPLKIYLGITNSDSGLLIGGPLAIWSGFADVITFQVGESISASLTAEHFSSHMRRTNGLRMTTESHNQRLGNPATADLFFEAQSRLMGRARPLLE